MARIQRFRSAVPKRGQIRRNNLAPFAPSSRANRCPIINFPKGLCDVDLKLNFPASHPALVSCWCPVDTTGLYSSSSMAQPILFQSSNTSQELVFSQHFVYIYIYSMYIYTSYVSCLRPDNQSRWGSLPNKALPFCRQRQLHVGSCHSSAKNIRITNPANALQTSTLDAVHTPYCRI